MNYKLILASASPRRQQLLKQIGIPFQVQSADIDETVKPQETPQNYVKRLALEKAQAIYQTQTDKNNIAVLGADTSVVYQNKIFGKPQNDAEAKQMLQQLQGQQHEVMTAIALVHNQTQHSAINISQVWFAALNDIEIDTYIATQEPFGKAGSYAIQGHAAAFITQIKGSYSSVMGLPLYETQLLLKKIL